MNIKKLLFIPDSHRPYHDQKSWELCMRAGEKFKPNQVIIGGDFGDCYIISDHDKNPERKLTFREEADDVIVGLKEIDTRMRPNEKYFVEGNHEWRLERYVMRKAPELWGLCTIKDIYQLDKLGWNHIPYKDHVKIGKLYITHDVGQAGKYAHYQALDAYQSNIIINHTHRMGYSVVGSLANGPHVGAMFGWLGDLNKIDYMHRAKAMRDWAHGFGIGYLLPNGEVHLQPIPIVNGRVVIEGKLITL